MGAPQNYSHLTPTNISDERKYHVTLLEQLALTGYAQIESLLETNSGTWDSTYSTVLSNSSQWAQSGEAGKLNISDFNTYSGNTSAVLSSKLAISDFNSYSSSLNFSYSATQIYNNSLVPGDFVSDALNNLSAGITGASYDRYDSVYNTVSATSAYWNSVHNTVSANSGVWGSASGKLNVTDFNTYSGNVSGEFATGDDLGLDYSPTNYTQATSTLSGHFTGIDTKVGLFSSNLDSLSSTYMQLSGKTLGSSTTFGNLTSNITFETNGFVQLTGGAVAWEDYMVPGFAVGLGNTPPDLISFLDATSGTLIYGFNGAGTTPIEQVYFTIQMPHSYKFGTDIHPHVHWCPTTTTTGATVEWSLTYSWSYIDGTFPTLSTITTVDATSGQWKHQYIEFPEIPAPTGDPGVSSMLNCRLFRDPSRDTYNADAGFLQFDIHFQRDTMGSRSELSK